MPEKDLLDIIVAAGIGFSLGQNAFGGLELPVGDGIPTDALFVAEQGGPPPSNRDLADAGEIRTAAVFLRLRWAGYVTGRSRSIQILDTLRGISVSGYQDVVCLHSGWRQMPSDQQGNSRWLIGYSMIYEAT